MVMHIPQRGPPRYYPEKEIGRPDETSGVESHRLPSKRELKKYPKEVLLKIAIELDPDTIKQVYEEGWTKEDIIKAIEGHVRNAVGSRRIEGWKYIRDIDILDAGISPEYSKGVQ